MDANDEDCEYQRPSTSKTSVALFQNLAMNIMFHVCQVGSVSCRSLPHAAPLTQNVVGWFFSPVNAAGQGFNHLEFKVVVEPTEGPSFSVVLLAPSRQEKAAWTSDISQVVSAEWTGSLNCWNYVTSVVSIK